MGHCPLHSLEVGIKLAHITEMVLGKCQIALILSIKKQSGKSTYHNAPSNKAHVGDV